MRALRLEALAMTDYTVLPDNYAQEVLSWLKDHHS